MKNYIDQIYAKIKSRTKEQWIHYLSENITGIRSYISENGEVSFLLAFIFGIFVVLFFKFAFSLFFIFSLLCAMVWCLADSDIEIRSNAELNNSALNDSKESNSGKYKAELNNTKQKKAEQKQSEQNDEQLNKTVSNEDTQKESDKNTNIQ